MSCRTGDACQKCVICCGTNPNNSVESQNLSKCVSCISDSLIETGYIRGRQFRRITHSNIKPGQNSKDGSYDESSTILEVLEKGRSSQANFKLSDL